MKEICIDGYVFSVDIEKTKQYYEKHMLCECQYCQYLYEQITDRYPHFKGFLSQFGVDISKPDTTSPVELNGKYDYTWVGYTVCGKVLRMDEYEMDLYGDGFLSIVVDDDVSLPNIHSGNFFSFTVFGITLPCETARELVPEKKEPIVKKIAKMLLGKK